MWRITYDLGQGPQTWECFADYESDAIEKCWAEFGPEVAVLEVEEQDG